MEIRKTAVPLFDQAMGQFEKHHESSQKSAVSLSLSALANLSTAPMQLGGYIGGKVTEKLYEIFSKQAKKDAETMSEKGLTVSTIGENSKITEKAVEVLSKNEKGQGKKVEGQQEPITKLQAIRIGAMASYGAAAVVALPFTFLAAIWFGIAMLRGEPDILQRHNRWMSQLANSTNQGAASALPLNIDPHNPLGEKRSLFEHPLALGQTEMAVDNLRQDEDVAIAIARSENGEATDLVLQQAQLMAAATGGKTSPLSPTEVTKPSKPDPSLANKERDQTFINYLASKFEYHPILPDGHCFFRSIMAGLAVQYEKATPESRQQWLFSVDQNVKKLNDANLTKEWADLRVNFEKLGQGMSVSEFMYQKGRSVHPFIQFLRDIACATIAKDQIIQNFVTQPSSHYITCMKKSAFGGSVEARILSSFLGVGICFYNARMKTDGPAESFLEGVTNSKVILFSIYSTNRISIQSY